jgi:hypothetical protein
MEIKTLGEFRKLTKDLSDDVPIINLDQSRFTIFTSVNDRVVEIDIIEIGEFKVGDRGFIDVYFGGDTSRFSKIKSAVAIIKDADEDIFNNNNNIPANYHYNTAKSN